MRKYPAPRRAWVCIGNDFGPADYLECLGHSVRDVRIAWSERYQQTKRNKRNTSTPTNQENGQ